MRVSEFAIDTLIKGPLEEDQKSVQVEVSGEVTDVTTTVSGWLYCSEGYHFTALSSLVAARKILKGNLAQDPGPYTPSMLFGTEICKGD